jgi:cellobiose phosphorylase
VYQAATQRILGVRAGYGGLVVDPRVPGAWKAFSVTRRFRGATYRIRVLDPSGAGKGVHGASIDGRPLEVSGGIAVLPPMPAGTVHEVEVELQ